MSSTGDVRSRVDVLAIAGWTLVPGLAIGVADDVTRTLWRCTILLVHGTPIRFMVLGFSIVGAMLWIVVRAIHLVRTRRKTHLRHREVWQWVLMTLLLAGFAVESFVIPQNSENWCGW